MSNGAKRIPPTADGKGYGGFLRLIAREPYLADAARLEAHIADLYLSVAGVQPDGPRGQRWLEAARLSREIADSLAAMAAVAGVPRHNPRPTRIRVATLRESDLAQTADRLESLRRSLGTNGTGPRPPDGPSPQALTDLATLEGRTVVLPLVRMFALAPASRLYNVWHTAAARRRVLRSLGIGTDHGAAAWPDPPRRRAAPTPRKPENTDAAADRAGRNAEWVVAGHVERVNRSRRCGTARTEDGRTAFFTARAVSQGLAALHPGDPVQLRLRKGPLGLTAVRVEYPQVEGPTR